MDSTASDKILTAKNKIGETIGIGLFVIIVFSLIYFNFIAKPESPDTMSAQEQRDLERKLINRYGSLENAEEVYRQQTGDGGTGVGHPVWNN